MDLSKLDKKELLVAAKQLQNDLEAEKSISSGLNASNETLLDINTELTKEVEEKNTAIDNLNTSIISKDEKIASQKDELVGTKKLLADASEELVKAKSENKSKPEEQEQKDEKTTANDGSHFEAKYNEAIVEKRKANQEVKKLKITINNYISAFKKAIS